MSRNRPRAWHGSESPGPQTFPVHLMTTAVTDPHPVLDQARTVLQDRYHLAHATLQIEPDTHQGCSEVSW